jgi:hypothetical protein
MKSPKLNIGDKVILMYMDDPQPVEALTIGVVKRYTSVFGDDQYEVDWEDGRRLSIISSVDKWETEESLMEKGNEKLLRIIRRKLDKFNN